MCGIVAYIGNRQACPILIEGLKRLEYRGYDSAGVALFEKELKIWRSVGRISSLEQKIPEKDADGSIGIAHTRWATHGGITEYNAHPHTDSQQRIALVHNGIIENYRALRTFMESKGIQFHTETDTEVLAQLIGYLYEGDIEKAVRAALRDVQGTYGIAVLCADEPDRIIAARKGSPLIMGVGEDEYIIASDASAVVQHMQQVIYLSDGEMVILTREGFRTTNLAAEPISKQVQDLQVSLAEIELGGYPHYMAKEIFEQPESLQTCMRGRINLQEEKIVLGGIANLSRDIVKARKILLTGCGTAWHACLVGEYLFEELARMPTEVEYASELRYRNPIIEEGTVVIALSQSGETADTLAAVREVKEKGAMVLGVVNTVGSTIAQETDAGIYLHVGPEIGVASTKAYLGQLMVLTMMALYVGRRRHLSQQVMKQYLEALARIPDQIGMVLKLSDQIKSVVKKHINRDNWLYLGRGYNFPTALEGALKLKEVSYIHAEGMPAAEMKHGPIALINENMPVVFVVTQDSQYDKVMSNIEEVRSRGGRIIAVATEGDTEISHLAEDVFYVPKTLEPLQPLLNVVPLQLVGYHGAVLRGCNVDKPRNLAKSVTVE